MGNDKDWQRRTDDWVNRTHKSRLIKQAIIIEKNKSKYKYKNATTPIIELTPKQ